MDSAKKRVLIVDDSVFARKIVADIIESSPDLEVVGAATNGVEGLKMLEQLRPDVVTLDVEMPHMDGIETLKQIMETRPTPVVMISSLTTAGAMVSMEALRIGAIDVMAKPHGSHSLGLTSSRNEVVAKILAAANVDLTRIRPIAPTKVKPAVNSYLAPGTAFPVVLIASSTGGPRALRTLIPGLATGNGAAYFIVQHIPEGFSALLAQDLNALTDLTVREAQEGDALKPGEVLMAKAGYHSMFNKSGKIELNQGPLLWGVRPSADITMASAIPVFKNRLIGAILTGMGRDGADGVRMIKEAGGATVAEHESTCVVYGMPRVAIESGCVDVIAPLDRIAEAINASVVQTAKRHARSAA